MTHAEIIALRDIIIAARRAGMGWAAEQVLAEYGLTIADLDMDDTPS